MQSDFERRYSGPAIALHWVMAVLIFAQIAIGLYMVDLPKRTPPVAYWYNLHKSLGIVAFALVLLRLWWKSRSAEPSLAGSHLSPLHIRAAQLSHRLLYACMVLTPLCGFIASNFQKYGVKFFGIQLPRLGWENETVHALFNGLHAFFAYLLCALIAVHLLAVAYHLWTSGMKVVRRMAPFGGK